MSLVATQNGSGMGLCVFPPKNAQLTGARVGVGRNAFSRRFLVAQNKAPNTLSLPLVITLNPRGGLISELLISR
jgi:hypothetical protein